MTNDSIRNKVGQAQTAFDPMTRLFSHIQLTGNNVSVSKQLNELAERQSVSMDYDRHFVTLPQSARTTYLMEFSPDGRRVASTHGDHKIYITDVKTCKVIKVLGND